MNIEYTKNKVHESPEVLNAEYERGNSNFGERI